MRFFFFFLMAVVLVSAPGLSAADTGGAGFSLRNDRDPAALPLFEDFDEAGVFPPAGWAYVNGVPEAYWEQSDFYSYEGEHSARAYQGFASGYMADEWLITPLLDFDEVENPLLIFYGFTNQEPDGIRERLYVRALDQVYDNPGDLHANAILVDYILVDNPYEWNEYIIDLGELSGAKHLAFHYYVQDVDDTSFCWLYIDKVQVDDFVTYTLSMQPPVGEGTVDPPPGDHEYSEGYLVDIVATPAFGWDFSHWEGDVDDPGQMQTFVLMDEDKTAQAHFIPLTPFSTPFFEDFSGLSIGQLPVGWSRTHVNWGAWPSANAGGTRPEMRFHWNPVQDDELLRLTTRPLDASHETTLEMRFRHFVNDFLGGYFLKVESSTDSITWNEEWQMYMKSSPAKNREASLFSSRDHGPEEVTINLDHLAGEDTFYISFVYEGQSNRINSWFIDDVFVGSDMEYFDVTFQVYCYEHDQPLQDVLIALQGEEGQAYTDGDGMAVFVLPPGDYPASLSKEGYEDKEIVFEVTDADLWIDLTMIPSDYYNNVIFNVSMHDAVFGDENTVFDPGAGHQLYLSGSFAGEWPVPGEDPEMQMHPRPENPDIFTLTLPLPGGHYEYKYFVIKEGLPGWDYGEWEGEPNREVFVDSPTVINDIWGEYEVAVRPVNEGDIRVYPNPASDRVYIRSDFRISRVEVMDAMGRRWLDRSTGLYETAIDVSSLSPGTYILRIYSGKELHSFRLQVMR